MLVGSAALVMGSSGALGAFPILRRRCGSRRSHLARLGIHTAHFEVARCVAVSLHLHLEHGRPAAAARCMILSLLIPGAILSTVRPRARMVRGSASAASAVRTLLERRDDTIKKALPSDPDSEASYPNRESRESFGFWVDVEPEPLPHPFLVSTSPDMLATLGLDASAAADAEFVSFFAGGSPPGGGRAWATVAWNATASPPSAAAAAAADDAARRASSSSSMLHFRPTSGELEAMADAGATRLLVTVTLTNFLGASASARLFVPARPAVHAQPRAADGPLPGRASWPRPAARRRRRSRARPPAAAAARTPPAARASTAPASRPRRGAVGPSSEGSQAHHA